MRKKIRKFYLFAFGPSLIIGLCLFLQPLPAQADHELLLQYITEYNLKDMKSSLIKGSYRGEAGILRIRPEVGESLGLQVFVDDDYRGALELYKKAERNLSQATRALRSRNNNEEELLKTIVDHFLQYKAEREEARQKMNAYHSRLKPGMDERLDDSLSRKHMEEILIKSLDQTNHQLRDALALFYNLCRDDHPGKYHLTVNNVRFVNSVYRHFVTKAPPEEKARFNLDLQQDMGGVANRQWEKVAREICPQFAEMLGRIIPIYQKEIYEIDPLLFIALMRRESNFNHLAISSVGAAGLTQIMPGTAVDLGMKNIYRPDYFEKAGQLLRQEREARREATSALFSINQPNGIKTAARARDLTKKSISLGQERERLFTRYKVALLREGKDSRLDPEKSIENGLIYFLRQMNARGGDISLALASYNAGPHRVQEYQGIPPFNETVHFRNIVLGYYRDYVKKAEKITNSSSSRVQR